LTTFAGTIYGLLGGDFNQVFMILATSLKLFISQIIRIGLFVASTTGCQHRLKIIVCIQNPAYFYRSILLYRLCYANANKCPERDHRL